MNTAFTATHAVHSAGRNSASIAGCRRWTNYGNLFTVRKRPSLEYPARRFRGHGACPGILRYPHSWRRWRRCYARPGLRITSAWAGSWRRHGVTGYFPTTVAAPLDATYARSDVSRTLSSLRSNPQSPAMRLRLGHWAFIWKDLSSATDGAACIRRSILSNRRWKSSSAYGRPREAMCA